MAELIFFGIFAFAAIVTFGLAASWVRRYPPVGVGLVCLILITLWEFQYPPPLFILSGLSVYTADLVALILVVAGALEFTQLRANLGAWLVPWALFGILITISLLMGVSEFGPGTAFNAARSVFYFFCAMTWALSIRADRLRLHTASLFLGWALVLVAAYHALRFGVGGPTTSISVGDFGVRNGRVLIASQAMALLLCAATLVMGPTGAGGIRSRFLTVSSLAFSAVVVVAEHRSVWAAGAFGLVAVWVWSTRPLARRQAIILLFLGAWVGLIGWSSGALDESEWIDSAASTDTYNWRTYSWQVLIAQAIARGPITVLAGEPFGGSGFLRRMPNGVWTSLSSHNWYVDIFLMLGVLGLVTLFPMLVWAFVKSRTLPAICTFSLAVIATYGWGYYVEWYFAPWLGAAITMSLQAGRTTQRSSSGSGPSANPKDQREGQVIATGQGRRVQATSIS